VSLPRPGMAGVVRGSRALCLVSLPASGESGCRTLREMPVRARRRGEQRAPLDGRHDVLICGASFAGLAVARELAGSGADVLVLDRYEIGERQNSPHGIPDSRAN